MRTWITIVLGVFLCGCACEPTPYQRAVGRAGKGYSEKRVSQDTFYVKYVSNTCTPDEVLSDYLHRRAAEVTLQYGFRYFTVLRDPSRPMELETREVPVQDEPRKWRTVVVEAPSEETLLMPIQCFKDAPESHDAALVDAKAYLDKRVGD